MTDQAENVSGVEDDDDLEIITPGHVVDMSLANQPDPAHPGKPYVAKRIRGRGAGQTVRFGSRAEAEAFIDETQRQSMVGFKESDRSIWD